MWDSTNTLLWSKGYSFTNNAYYIDILQCSMQPTGTSIILSAGTSNHGLLILQVSKANGAL